MAGTLCQQPCPGPGQYTAGVLNAGGREAAQPSFILVPLTSKAKERMVRVGAAWTLGSHKSRLCRGIRGKWAVRVGTVGLAMKHGSPGSGAKIKAQGPALNTASVCPLALPEGPGVPGSTAEEGSGPDFPLCFGGGGGGRSRPVLCGSEGVPNRSQGLWEVCRSLLGKRHEKSQLC